MSQDTVLKRIERVLEDWPVGGELDTQCDKTTELKAVLRELAETCLATNPDKGVFYFEQRPDGTYSVNWKANS